MSEGSPSEAGCYATADAAYDYLMSRKDIDPKRIVAAGWSLGSGVAVDLASRRPVVGLATFSAFTSMADMASRTLPMFPVRLFLKYPFESERKIRTIGCPIFIGHGRQDHLVPYEMSDRLAAAAKGPVTRFSCDGSDHNDFFQTSGRPLLEALGSFLSRFAQEP